jgi:hypothetical protein
VPGGSGAAGPAGSAAADELADQRPGSGAAVGDSAAGEDADADADAADLAWRRARAERAVRGAAAAALSLEALAVLFVPRAIAQVGQGLTAWRLAVLLGLAGGLLVAAGLQRRRAGLVLGCVLQAAVIATGLLAGAMYVLGAVFALAWLYLLRVRREVLARWAPPAGPVRPQQRPRRRYARARGDRVT